MKQVLFYHVTTIISKPLPYASFELIKNELLMFFEKHKILTKMKKNELKKRRINFISWVPGLLTLVSALYTQE